MTENIQNSEKNTFTDDEKALLARAFDVASAMEHELVDKAKAEAEKTVDLNGFPIQLNPVVEAAKGHRFIDDKTVDRRHLLEMTQSLEKALQEVSHQLKIANKAEPSRVRKLRLHMIDICGREAIPSMSNRLEFAEKLVRMVEAGHLGYAEVVSRAESITLETGTCINQIDLAFATGLAAGWMGFYTPEKRG